MYPSLSAQYKVHTIERTENMGDEKTNSLNLTHDEVIDKQWQPYMDMVFPYKSEADLKSIYSRREWKNVNKHAARETGYANRDIQSGITFDTKINLYTAKDFFS